MPKPYALAVAEKELAAAQAKVDRLKAIPEKPEPLEPGTVVLWHSIANQTPCLAILGRDGMWRRTGRQDRFGNWTKLMDHIWSADLRRLEIFKPDLTEGGRDLLRKKPPIFTVTSDTSGHGLIVGTVVQKVTGPGWDKDGADWYTTGPGRDIVAINPDDLAPAEQKDAVPF